LWRRHIEHFDSQKEFTVSKQRYTVGEVVEALEQSRGLITQASALLGCSRGTITNYAARYPTVAETLKWKRLELTDLAMSALYEAVEAGAPWAILFTLRTFGADRGYGDDPQTASGGPLVIETVAPRQVVFHVVRPDEIETLDEIGSTAPIRAIAG
jgi:hypothetical protein